MQGERADDSRARLVWVFRGELVAPSGEGVPAEVFADYFGGVERTPMWCAPLAVLVEWKLREEVAEVRVEVSDGAECLRAPCAFDGVLGRRHWSAGGVSGGRTIEGRGGTFESEDRKLVAVGVNVHSAVTEISQAFAGRN